MKDANAKTTGASVFAYHVRAEERYVVVECDAIGSALCIDEHQSSQDDIIYRTDIGYIRLFDKRESGETINVVYEFDANTLKMSQHPLLKASDVEVRFNKQ